MIQKHPILLSRFKRALQNPPRIVMLKILIKIKDLIRRIFLNVWISWHRNTWVSDKRIKFAALESLGQIGHFELGINFPFCPAHKLQSLVSILKADHPKHVQAVTAAADQYLAGNHRVLEEKPRNLKALSIELAKKHGIAPTYLPWHYDFISGRLFDPKALYLNIDYAQDDGRDVKVPWELSRFHHLVTLAQAYLITEDAKYCKEIFTQISDWYEHNPPAKGVNWACTMDVGIRIANILFALGLIENKLAHHPEELKHLKRILPSLVFNHAMHIVKNFEWTSNHFLANLAGLSFAGRMYPHFRASRYWTELSQDEFNKQMDFQVYADGMDFEASTSYHRLVTEFFLFSYLITDKDSVRAQYKDKLKKMVEATYAFTKGNGHAAQFGDNDSGRFLALNPGRPLLDHSYLAHIGSCVFKDLKPPIYCHDPAPESLWLLGPAQADKNMKERQSDGAMERKPVIVSLPNGGIHTFHDPAKKHFLAFCTIPNGQAGNGGHSHNDKLAIEFSPYGEDLFVDPGTGCYLRNRSLRNQMRSTSSHTTLILNNEEQNRMDLGPFCLKEDVTKIPLLRCEYDPKTRQCSFSGEHNGYGKLKPPITHKRSLLLKNGDKCELGITDELLTPSSHHEEIICVWNFILHPQASLVDLKADRAAISMPSGRVFAIVSQIPLEKGEFFYSPEFGVTTKTIRITAKATTMLPQNFVFNIIEQ
ncbi:alginate lyase family protein [Elusimicrobiota bacterium]